MKKHCLTTILFFLHICMVNAQNLVPNASFETFITCPTGNSQLNGNVPPWVNPPGSGTTPDYFNACAGPGSGCSDIDVPVNFAGISTAFEGDAYAGFLTYYTSCPNCREYVQVQLTSALTAGQTYMISMRARLGSQSQYATNNIGMYISTNAVAQPGNQPIAGVTPQANPVLVVKDTTSWTLVSTSYLAAGGENYLTIGNFYDNSSTDIDTLGFSTSSCALASAGAFYYIDSVNVVLVTTSSAPNVSFISSDTIFCDKKCLDFTDLSTNNPTSWQWLFPGAVPSSDTVQHPTNICYNAYGTFDVTLIACNAAGCDTLYVPSFITEYQLPPQPVITQSNDTLYCTPASSYAWYNTSNPGIIISTDSFYTSSLGGSFFVIVGDSLGCQNASTVFVATGIAALPTDDPRFILYPNPARDVLTIEIQTPELNSSAILQITDMTGKLILESRLSEFQNHIDISPFDNGWYLFRLTSDTKSLILKLFIQH